MPSSLSELAVLTLELGLLALGGSAIFMIVLKATRLALTLFLVTAVLANNQMFYASLLTTFGSVNVFFDDVLTVMFGAVALHRLGRATMRPVARNVGLVLTLLVGLGIVTWVVAEGLQAGVNMWRPWLLSIAAFWWAATLPGGWTWSRLQPFVWAGLFASGFQAFGFSQTGLGSAVALYSRPLFATSALLMLVALSVIVLEPGKWTTLRVAGAIWLSGAVLVAQHRSVWVGALVMLAIGGLSMIRANSQNWRGIVFGSIVVGASALVVLFFVTGQTELEESATDAGTLEWRNDQWSALLQIPRSFGEWLVGSVLGPTSVTDPTSQFYLRNSAHSMYVETVGVIGLAGLALVVVLLLVGFTFTGMQLSTWTVTVAAGLAGYGVFYQWPGWTWVVFGIAASKTGQAPLPGYRQHSRFGTLPNQDFLAQGNKLPRRSVPALVDIWPMGDRPRWENLRGARTVPCPRPR